MALRGNQRWQSVAITLRVVQHSEWPSEAISGPQWPSETRTSTTVAHPNDVFRRAPTEQP